MAEGGERTDEEKCEFIEVNLVEQKDEVLALESIFAESDQFTIVCGPEVDEKSLYVLEVKVNVGIEDDGIDIEAWFPYDDSGQEPQIRRHGPKTSQPQFERTISGQRWHSCFHVDYLPPVILNLTMPEGYPSVQAPKFTLSCEWLSKSQLCALGYQLDQVWSESFGFPVVYSWIDWLQTNCLGHLCINKTLTFAFPDDDQENNETDERVDKYFNEVGNALMQVLRYDYQQDWKHFLHSTHNCNICFDEKLGRNFFRISECYHHFCQECMTHYCQVHIGEGTVQYLVCPEQKCKATIPPAIIQDCVGEEAYKKWERLLLQKALDTMEDVEYCPRCHMPVIRDSDERQNLAYCVYCHFTFCTKCSESWHVGENCKNIEEQLELMKKNAESDEKCISKREHRRRMALLLMERMSIKFVKKISKLCPSCRMSIEKFGGCNQVVCSQCGGRMCWVCGKSIKGYGHFSESSCIMFPGQDEFEPMFHNPRPRVERPEAAGAARVREALINRDNDVNLKRCPRCRQMCLKEGRNNHLRCWSCRTNFCFSCGNRIEGLVTKHFVTTNCVQHS